MMYIMMIMQNHPTSISKSSLKVLWCIHFRYNCRICRACSMQRAFNVPLRWWLPGRCGPTRKRPKSWPLTRRTPRSWFGWSELSSAGDFFISFKISDFQISSFSSFSFSDFLGSFVFFDHLQLLQSHNYITLYIYILLYHTWFILISGSTMGLCSRCSLGTRLSGAALTGHRPLRSNLLRQFLDNRYVTAGEELRLTVRC